MKTKRNNRAYYRLLLLAMLYMLWLPVSAQMNAKPTVTDPQEIEKLRKAVEADINNPAVHAAYIKAVTVTYPGLKAQYESWTAKHPSSIQIPLAYATALYHAELPEAKPWLLKVVQIDPKQAQTWQMLWIDAERWGDFAGGREYLRKATEADPASADHAFYYASSFEHADSVKHHQLMISMPDRYPGTERGAQALYWLANRSASPKTKVQVYELLKKKYNPEASGWCSGGMQQYYDFLVEHNVPGALELSNYMLGYDSLNGRQAWVQRKEIAQALLDAKKVMAQKNYVEAFLILNKVAPARYSNTKEILLTEKAKAAAAAGEFKTAYDSLLLYYAVNPTDGLMNSMKGYAKKLGKTDADINNDVWEKRKAAGKEATAFKLDNYLTPGKTSLADLKGKVVLVTYWFPGCGPCRGEFPHFENVVRKFSKNELAYIGINMVHDQDPYVVPFMKQSGYSFIPVRDEPEKRGNLIARGAPTNYLIDKKGNIIFANFRTDGDNERTLELMIRELLEKS